MPSTAIKTTDVLLRAEFAPKVLDGTKRMTRRIIELSDKNILSIGQRKLGWTCNPSMARVGDVGRMVASLVGKVREVCDQQISVPARHPHDDNIPWEACGYERIYCPYGGPGDHLRFLTTWAVDHKWDRHKPLDLPRHVKVWTAFDNGSKPRGGLGKLRPGRFMPLWIRKRLPVFELTEVRVERINEITSADVVAEGFPFSSDLDAFKTLWAKLNGAESWKRGDWCWVLSFQRINPLSQEAR